MHFLLTALKVVYVLTTPMLEWLEDATVEAIRVREKWKNDDYICRGHIQNGMSDSLFDVYTNIESAKELWDLLESKYMAEDSSSKKFLVDAIAWWIDSGATTHVCKDRYWLMQLRLGIDSVVPDDSDSVYMSSSTIVNSSLWHALFRSRIIHETTASYTLQQNSMAERKNRALKEMVNSMLSYSGLSEGFQGEAMAVVRLPDPKRKTFGENGIDCIFVGYAEHSKAYRFYVIEPNESVFIKLIIESKDAIFDENRFSSIPRPNDIIPNSVESQRDDHSIDVPSEIPEPRKGKRVRKAKSYGSDFQLYLVEGSRDQVGSQYSYCYSIDEDPRTNNEAMQSRDASLWKEAIDDEIGSIMENNTWVLFDLLPGCKPLGCKWIFKRKMKVDGTIDKFKARLVIQGFRQKEGIDYFNTYAPIAHIKTIRLLLALVAIHNLVIHQMDVKTAFLN
ncbi:zinc finger, CCHC-type containing protein, partial [Tanacetum coccineum]